MISVLKLTSGEFIIAEHKEENENPITVKISNPFIVDWRISRNGSPYIGLMRWAMGVRTHQVSLTKASIVAIFSPTEELEQHYIEVIKSKEYENSLKERHDISEDDISYLEDLVRRMSRGDFEQELEDWESEEDEELHSKKINSPGNDTIH